MNFSRLTIAVIVLDLLIPFAAGHGMGFLGMIEMPFVSFFTNDSLSLSPSADYEHSLFGAALFSLTGQLFLLVSIWIKKPVAVFRVKIIGLIFLCVGYFYLVHNIFSEDGSLSAFSGFFGLGFFVCSIILIYKMVRERRKTSGRFDTL